MTERRAFDVPSMGPSCTFYLYAVISFLFFVASSSTIYFSLHVQIKPTHDRVFSRGFSKSFSPLNGLIIVLHNQSDPKYVPPRTRTPTNVSYSTKATPTRAALSIVSASMSDDERMLTGTPSRYGEENEGASGSEDASCAEKVWF